MFKRVVGLLLGLFVGASSSAQELSGDPTNDVPGLHVLSEYGSQYSFIDEKPTIDVIRRTITSLDWRSGFHQVVLVTAPGVSLEVGGSLNPNDGLSSVYRDIPNDIFRITKEPPTTIENMVDLLVSFHLGDEKWELMYEFE